jgi:hypothetical protein
VEQVLNHVRDSRGRRKMRREEEMMMMMEKNTKNVGGSAS